MTKVVCPPITPGPLSSARFAQNDCIPSQAALRRVAWGYNHSAVNQKRILFAHSNSTQSTPAPPTNGISLMRFPMRTSENVSALGCWLGLAPASSTDGTNKAGVTFGIYDGATDISSPTVYYPKVQAGAYTPSEVAWVWCQIPVSAGLAANTRYAGYFVQLAYSRIHSAVVYEISESVGLSSVAGVADPTYWQANKPIYDDGVQDLAETGTKLWQHNARVLLSLSRKTLATVPVISSSTYGNLLATGTSAFSASAPGFMLDTQYSATQKGGVPVELGVRVRRTAGTGDLHVKLDQGGGTILSTTISGTSTAPYAVSTHTILAHAATKTDILMRCSDGSTTYEIDCIGLWEYEA